MSAMEDVLDDIEDRVLQMEAKFDGLKDFVFYKLKECLDTAEELRTKKRSADSFDISVAGTSSDESTPAKKAKASPVEVREPQDIQDAQVREGVLKYIKQDYAPGEKLTHLQLAFVQYYMTDVQDGYSARRSVISNMIDSGTANGIWRKGFVPDGIKNSFQSYLRDKVKNLQKKRLQQKSMDDFAGEFTINNEKQSSV